MAQPFKRCRQGRLDQNRCLEHTRPVGASLLAITMAAAWHLIASKLAPTKSGTNDSASQAMPARSSGPESLPRTHASLVCASLLAIPMAAAWHLIASKLAPTKSRPADSASRSHPGKVVWTRIAASNTRVCRSQLVGDHDGCRWHQIASKLAPTKSRPADSASRSHPGKVVGTRIAASNTRVL